MAIKIIKICFVLGTRPEIIKLSPIIRECQKRNIEFKIIHTGQHYSREMDSLFFEELKLPKPNVNLSVGSGKHGKQTGRMLERIEAELEKEKPSIVFVQGDTNSVLAGALAAAKLNIAIGHVEAGLRSDDRTMPEEINRIMTDHIATLLFTPTEEATKNLVREGISEKKIHLTGNTIVDAVWDNIKLDSKEIMTKLQLKEKEFILVTVHRQENTDVKEKLNNIMQALEEIAQTSQLKVVYPMHPRTKKKLKEFNLHMPKIVKCVEPISFLEFTKLEQKAKLIITDSGGVQEEACILGTPCITLRENTERPETIQVGANKLAGTEKTRIVKIYKEEIKKNNQWKNPFGDGKASEKIINKTVEYFQTK